MPTKPSKAKKSSKPKSKQIPQATESKLEVISANKKAEIDVSHELEQMETIAATTESEITIKCSKALVRKIDSLAKEEGISIEDFLKELVSEGVVLRAWEIVERKAQMRGGNQNHGNQGSRQGNGNGNGNGHRNNSGNHHRKGRGGMSHTRYQSIMDDKATFLEYVRNQEKGRR
jgi:hypothetical protein